MKPMKPKFYFYENNRLVASPTKVDLERKGNVIILKFGAESRLLVNSSYKTSLIYFS